MKKIQKEKFVNLIYLISCVFWSGLFIIFWPNVYLVQENQLPFFSHLYIFFPSNDMDFPPRPILHLHNMINITNKIKFPLSTKKNNWDQFSSQLTFPRNLSSISLIISCHFSSILFLPIYTNIVLILYQQNMFKMCIFLL